MPWPNMKFEYVVYILLLLGSIVILMMTMMSFDVQNVYKVEKEIQMLLGKRLMLTTLNFDLNIHHPYKPFIPTIKKF
jgi:hypothetical protein